MLEFLLSLGLRSASASTMQVVTFYFLAATEGVEKTVAFTSDSRYSMYVATKGWFRRLVKNRSAPEVKLTTLYASPADLQVDHPEFYESLYGTDPPSSSLQYLIPLVAVEQLKAHTRSGRKNACPGFRLPIRTTSHSSELAE